MIITIQNDAYGAEMEKLSAVEDGAKRFDNLLRTEYHYKSPSQIRFGCNVFENIKTGDKLLKVFGDVLEKWQEKGVPVGRFVLYYHGHGVQVNGLPCLLTTDGEAVPIEELVNKAVQLLKAERYIVISDCCANKFEFKDEATKKRVREAHAVVKDENIVKIKAVPDGKRAEADEGKTLTFALVAILEWEGRGVPLRKLEDELREEQRRQESKNVPIIEVSQGSKNVPIVEVSDEFAKESFPL